MWKGAQIIVPVGDTFERLFLELAISGHVRCGRLCVKKSHFDSS